MQQAIAASKIKLVSCSLCKTGGGDGHGRNLGFLFCFVMELDGKQQAASNGDGDGDRLNLASSFTRGRQQVAGSRK